MDLNESYVFGGSPAVVWDLLNDPGVIASCLPGCEKLQPIGDDRYRAVLALTVAAISGQFTGTVAILDKQPPHSYRMVVEGSGKPGFINGQATIELVEQDGGTLVKVVAQGDAGGLIASVGQRLLQTVGKMMMNRFFACLQARITGGGA